MQSIERAHDTLLQQHAPMNNNNEMRLSFLPLAERVYSVGHHKSLQGFVLRKDRLYLTFERRSV